MNCTPSGKAIEELGERIAEGIKRITQSLGVEVGKEGRALEWFEQQVMQALKETGQLLLAGLCELGVERYVVAWQSISASGKDNVRRYSVTWW